MSNIPKFKLYGEDDPTFPERIQSKLPLRPWSSLAAEEKIILYEDLRKNLWFERHPRNLVDSLKQLNYCFKRILPARNIFDFDLSVPPQSQRLFSAAITDFKKIFVYSDSEDLVLCMISMFADGLISKSPLENAQESEDFEERKRLVTSAFRTFDIFARHLNYLFDQFSVNIFISRSGMVARQDDRITKEIYIPTLEVLSDPKWNSVNSILIKMFADYQDQQYSEVITKAHSALHRFLQIALENEGHSGKGEFGKLFNQAKSNNVISNSGAIEHIVNSIKSFLSSERAKKSTAKPTVQKASSVDALLVMNYCFLLIHHCLQNISCTPNN